MRYFIGIDDTDNLESRGTGHRARMLGLGLTELNLGRLESITRHQLLVSPLIPYTSHNSSASIVVSGVLQPKDLTAWCREFLLKESADGSDAGLCIAEESVITEELCSWGMRAKAEVLSMSEALSIAGKHEVFLEGLTGERTGIIGALAAIGLRKKGNDGRLLWLPGLREIQGVHPAGDILKKMNLDRIVDMSMNPVSSDSLISLGDWSRPVMKDGKITMIVSKNDEYEDSNYTCAPKEYIKSISG